MDAPTATPSGKERLPVAAVILMIFVVSWIGTVPQVMGSWVGGAKAVPGYVKLLQIFILAPGLVALWAHG